MSSVDVVVSSPTSSPVRSGCLTHHRGAEVLLRIFQLNSFAMVTPSLHTIGRPHFFLMRTRFDFGPRSHARHPRARGSREEILWARDFAQARRNFPYRHIVVSESIRSGGVTTLAQRLPSPST